MTETRTNSIVLLLALICSVVYADNINGLNISFKPIYGANAADANGYGAVGYNYRIGTTEVSISQFQASPISDANEDYWNSGGKTVGTNAPVVNITWHQAAQYCNWLTSSNVNTGAYTVSGGGLVTDVTDREGGAMNALVSTYGQVYVLPTEDEWYKAAYYKDGSYSLYANGTGTAPTHGFDANFNTGGGYANGPAWAVNSGTPEQNGTLNMMGNVWEWLESADDGVLDNLGTEKMAFRGGDYFQGVGLLDSSARGTPELPSGEFLNTGLRVVAIPEPGTMTLMGFSTVGLFMTRSIRRRKRLGQSLMPIRQEHLCDTFGSEPGMNAGMDVEDEDALALLARIIEHGCVQLWSGVVQIHQSLEKAFWNRMVIMHEKRVARRIRLRKAVRKKALDAFDSFLALIMK